MPQLLQFKHEYATLDHLIGCFIRCDYNHVDLKNSMTVALDFYTLFSNRIYTICSGLTAFF